MNSITNERIVERLQTLCNTMSILSPSIFDVHSIYRIEAEDVSENDSTALILIKVNRANTILYIIHYSYSLTSSYYPRRLDNEQVHPYH